MQKHGSKRSTASAKQFAADPSSGGRKLAHVQTVFCSQVPIESQALGRSRMDIFLRLGYLGQDVRVDMQP
jgi:hypothetical protein